MISTSQFEQRHKSLTAIAKKVYAAVPISEPWSPSFIHSEMQRLGSSTRDAHIVEGCLNSLKTSGLVLEPARRVFIRAPIRPAKSDEETTTHKEETPMAPAKPTIKTLPRNPMAILMELASKCKALQDEIELAALEIDEYVTAKDGDAAKLKQLQTLLKSLS